MLIANCLLTDFNDSPASLDIEFSDMAALGFNSQLLGEPFVGGVASHGLIAVAEGVKLPEGIEGCVCFHLGST